MAYLSLEGPLLLLSLLKSSLENWSIFSIKPYLTQPFTVRESSLWPQFLCTIFQGPCSSLTPDPKNEWDRSFSSVHVTFYLYHMVWVFTIRNKFILQLIWCIMLIYLQILGKNPCISAVNPTWSWSMILLLYCRIWFASIFVEDFWVYVQEWYWSVIFFFSDIFV